MYKFTSYNLIALCHKLSFDNGFSLYYSICWLTFVGYTTLYLCPMWVNLTQLLCRRKSELSGLSSAHSPLMELTNLQKWNCSGYDQSRLHLFFVVDFDQCEGLWICFWCLLCFKADSGERREGNHGQSPGATTDQCKWFYTWTRGLEGQRCGEDTGGATSQGEGKKSTLGKQEMPGAATPNRTGEYLMPLKVVNRKMFMLCFWVI